MRVLFVFNSVYPEGMAMSKRLHLIGKALIHNGVSVDLVTTSVNKDYNVGIFEGVKFSSIKDPVVMQNYFLRQINKFFAGFYFGNYCFRKAKEYDVILNPSFGWFTALLMIFGAHLGGAKVVMDVNENPYSPEGGRLDAVWIRKIRRRFMLKFTYRYADGLIIISEALVKLIKNYKKNAQIIKIPIITDKINFLRNSLNEKESPFILHAGALSETKDGAEAMFEAYAKACNQSSEKLRFILTSELIHPRLRQKIDSIIAKHGLNEFVFFTGHLSKYELEQLINSCTLSIINKPSNWQNDYNFPTKLGELLMAGVPLIVSKTGEMNKFLVDNETAFMVTANNVVEILGKILFILNNQDFANKVGLNGQKLALEKFYYMNYSDKLTEFFEKLIV